MLRIAWLVTGLEVPPNILGTPNIEVPPEHITGKVPPNLGTPKVLDNQVGPPEILITSKLEI